MGTVGFEMEPISVLLVDDNPIFLNIAAQFLRASPDVTVVGTANGGEEALVKAEALQPNVILLDLAMPDIPGLEAIPRLRSILPEVSIIALTLLATDGYRQAALSAGAQDFIPKAKLSQDLLPAIRRVMQAGQDQAPADADLAGAPAGDSAAPKQVLIMEDDHHLLRLYSKALDNAGYQVTQASTIDEARDMLESERFDLLLCDIHMDGEKATDLLREQAANLATSGTQVIMVSGQAQYRAMCEEMGADFFLEKPVPVATLVSLVNRLTARQSFYT